MNGSNCSGSASRPSFVFILWDGLHVVSGVTSWARLLRAELRSRGVPAQIFVHRPSPDPDVLGDVDGAFWSLDELMSLVRPLSPALVVLMNDFRQGHYAPALALLNGEGLRVDAISVVHSDSESEYYRFLPRFAPWVQHFVGVSDPIVSTIRARIGERSLPSVSLLPCCVACPQALQRTYQGSPLRLIYGGRLERRQKRVTDLIDLTNRLLARGVSFQLTIAGEGSALGELEHELEHAVRSQHVHFMGRVDAPRMPSVWAQHDAFINVSEFEGTSVAMLEAMAAGCVPVVTRTRSGSESVIEHGRNGLLVEVGDMEAMARSIDELARPGSRVAVLGAAAHETVRRTYSVDAYIAELTRLAEQITSRPKIVPDAQTHAILDLLLATEAALSQELARAAAERSAFWDEKNAFWREYHWLKRVNEPVQALRRIRKRLRGDPQS